MNEDQAYAGPRHHWRIGRYTFGMYRWNYWGCSDGSLGSSAKTPVGALLRQRRWVKERREDIRRWMEGDR